LLSPESVEKAIARHDPAGVQQEQSQQCSLLVSAEPQRLLVDHYLERSENPELTHVSVVTLSADP
jgi:hypothetical protein